MKPRYLKWAICSFGVATVTVSGVFLADAYASSSSGFEFTRATYDVIMRWVNFLIMVALFLRYARKPLLDFLRRQRSDVVSSLEILESRKREVEEKIEESKTRLEDSQKRLITIRERIENEGRQRKEQIVAEAQAESQLMLAAAKAKVEGQIREAVDIFKAELIDKATERASVRLPSLLKQNDHENFVHQWLEAAQQS